MAYRSSIGVRNRHRNRIPVVIFFIIVALVVYLFRAPIAHTFSKVRYTIYSYVRTDGSAETIRDSYIQSLENENSNLRDSLETISSSTKREFVNYPVITTPPFSPYDTLVIDTGRSSVKPLIGAFVQTLDGYIIGKVEQTEGNTAIVKLFSSSGFKNQVRIGKGSTTVSAVAEGMGGGNFYVKLPQNTKVVVGDPVKWVAKKHIFLGAVEYIELDKGSAFNDIYFKLPVNISQLLYVSIEKNNH